MALSIYVHIPYCLQRCRYCDFATFEQSEILPPDQYVTNLRQEIRQRRPLWRESEIKTLYFGGGTPSLISPGLILDICHELANCGFNFRTDCETTIEINPATMNEDSLRVYTQAGVNRFSVGAQTFNDRLLGLCGRKHSAEDTRRTLRFLSDHGLNYSFDLLFALPSQSKSDLLEDLKEVIDFAPPHLSAYCLTVPEGHPMNSGRPPEGEQIEMFDLITEQLYKIGLEKYEISNFARPGYESRHNLAYWNDSSYWGVGLSSHSYDRNFGSFGTRFWNPKTIPAYLEQAQSRGRSWIDFLGPEQVEELKEHEALTDFCHIHLRTMRGLPKDTLQRKFPIRHIEVSKIMDKLIAAGWIYDFNDRWALSEQGQVLSNQVFSALTFLAPP